MEITGSKAETVKKYILETEADCLETAWACFCHGWSHSWLHLFVISPGRCAIFDGQTFCHGLCVELGHPPAVR